MHDSVLSVEAKTIPFEEKIKDVVTSYVHCLTLSGLFQSLTLSTNSTLESGKLMAWGEATFMQLGLMDGYRDQLFNRII